MRFRLATWLWMWAGWTSLAVFFGTSLWLNYVAVGREASFRASLTIALTEWWTWAALTPLVVLLARRWPLAASPRTRAVLVHLAAGAAVAVTKVLVERAIRAWIFGVAPYLLPGTLALHFLIYWAIVALAHAAEYYGRSRARELRASHMEAQLNQARFEALEGQLRPHFLFNALNTIAETIHEDPGRADDLIADLGGLLRATLETGSATIPLGRELDHAGRYLAIEQARYGTRLRVDIDVPEELHAHRVPRFVLQPLLENAVHHGVGSRPEGGSVTIRAGLSNGSLRLVVEDDGDGRATASGPVDDAGARNGIGLANTRARLDVLYGARAGIDLRRREAGGTSVIVRIPVSGT